MKWMFRTSSVRVSDENGERLYQSLEEMPEELREKIVEGINSDDAQTILIANQKAYDQIAEGGDDLPEELERLKPALLRHRKAQERPPRQPHGEVNWRGMLAGGLGLIVLLWAMWLWAIQSGT